MHDLSDSELLERVAACADHCVVECATCVTDYRIAGLAIDVFSTPPRHFLCPVCRNDLADAVRGHAETCRRLAGALPSRTHVIGSPLRGGEPDERTILEPP